MTITELADADGHIIEPGDLWVERLPKDLRDMAPRWFRDEAGTSFTSASTASTSRASTSCTAESGRATCCRAWDWHAPWVCRWSACSPPTTAIASRSSTRRRGRATDASGSSSTPTHKVGRAVLFPTFMLPAARSCRTSRRRCAGLQRLAPRRLLRGLRRPAHSRAALPVIDVDAVRRRGEARCAERGYQVVFVRTNSGPRKKYSDPGSTRSGRRSSTPA